MRGWSRLQQLEPFFRSNRLELVPEACGRVLEGAKLNNGHRFFV